MGFVKATYLFLPAMPNTHKNMDGNTCRHNHCGYQSTNCYSTTLIVRLVIWFQVTFLEDLWRCVTVIDCCCCCTIRNSTVVTPSQTFNLACRDVAGLAWSITYQQLDHLCLRISKRNLIDRYINTSHSQNRSHSVLLVVDRHRDCHQSTKAKSVVVGLSPNRLGNRDTLRNVDVIISHDSGELWSWSIVGDLEGDAIVGTGQGFQQRKIHAVSQSIGEEGDLPTVGVD